MTMRLEDAMLNEAVRQRLASMCLFRQNHLILDPFRCFPSRVDYGCCSNTSWLCRRTDGLSNRDRGDPCLRWAPNVDLHQMANLGDDSETEGRLGPIEA